MVNLANIPEMPDRYSMAYTRHIEHDHSLVQRSATAWEGFCTLMHSMLPPEVATDLVRIAGPRFRRDIAYIEKLLNREENVSRMRGLRAK
jgi:hypothetical protein